MCVCLYRSVFNKIKFKKINYKYLRKSIQNYCRMVSLKVWLTLFLNAKAIEFVFYFPAKK